MDTRTLGTKYGGDEIHIIDKDSDNHDVVAAVFTTDDEEADAERTALADEMVKRFNAYPRLIAFIQQAGNTVEADELEDFIANNIEDVLENEEGEPIEEDIPYFNNPEIFK